MTTTKRIPRRQWKNYFDKFTKRHLGDDRPESASVDLLSSALGDQGEADDAHLLGIAFDPKSDALEVLLQNVDHLVFEPREIWVVEETNGFLRGIELVRKDGTREIMRVQPSVLPALRQAFRPEQGR
jgi:hypothetical protein